MERTDTWGLLKVQEKSCKNCHYYYNNSSLYYCDKFYNFTGDASIECVKHWKTGKTFVHWKLADERYLGSS